MAANQPTLIPEAWASQGSRTTIPDTTSETGRASWALGFPPETALPLGAGGVPPHWLDFQGVLHALSSHAVFQQQGGRYGWEATLDYPVGACVLGSDGHVYQASQASGPGTAAGAKNPTNAANASYWGQAATPDGATIKVVNGKLTVNNTSVAPLLADNVTTVNNAGKITVDLSNATAAALKKISQYVAKSDGGLRMDTNTGKLIVDFSLMPTAEFESIVQGMVQTGGGLAVDSQGQLYVDFDSMPTDKFEALLSSLKMQIPLSANMTVYVATNDAAASDTIDDGRGTSAKPFKTIQACVNYITQNFALGIYNIYIRIKQGTYSESVTLPVFTRTSGSVTLMADDDGNPPNIVNSTNTGIIITVSGGPWYLRRIIVQGTRTASNNGLENFHETVVATGADSSVTLQGCVFIESFTGQAPIAGHNHIRMITARSGGSLTFGTIANYGNKIEYHKGNATSLTVIMEERSGSMILPSTNSDTAVVDIETYGEASVFINVDTNSTFSKIPGGLHSQQFVVPQDQAATGTKYRVARGSGIYAPSDGFPGDVSGTADAATCGWYSS